MSYRKARFNIANINPDKIKETPQGGIRVKGTILKSGIFVYTTTDGKEVREWVPKESIMNEESLATLEGSPVTNEHPDQMISPDNYKENAIGFVTNVEVENEKYIVADLIINDQQTIDQIMSGKKKELSAGYWANTEKKNGILSDGQAYDAIQKDLFFNHCSVVQMGRCGSDVSLRLNSKENQILEYGKNVEKTSNNSIFNEQEPIDSESNKMTKKEKVEDKKTEKKNEGLTEEEMKQLQEASADLAKFNSLLEKLEYSTEDFFKLMEEKEEAIKSVLNGKEVVTEKENNDDDFNARVQSEAQRRVDLLVAARELGVEGITGKETTPELQLQIVKTSKPHMDLEGRSQEVIDAFLEDSLSGVDINSFWAKPKEDAVEVAEEDKANSVEDKKEENEKSEKKEKKSNSNLDSILGKLRGNGNDEEVGNKKSPYDELESVIASNPREFFRLRNPDFN